MTTGSQEPARPDSQVATDASSPKSDPAAAAPSPGAPAVVHAGFWTLFVGCIGVVYGDIGTSPLYALREALLSAGAAHSGVQREDVIGILSLILWTLTIIVTLKYVIILLHADNDGEGGTLSLMALAQRAIKGNSRVVFLLGVTGAELFFGDAMITP